MLKWTRTFFKDLGELPKHKFFLKYLLPGLVIFFSWLFLGYLYLVNMDAKTLTRYQGQVQQIDVETERSIGGKYEHNNLNIVLIGTKKKFRLSDAYAKEFNQLQMRIAEGDTVTLYTRRWWQILIGAGTAADIYQVEQNDNVIFGFSEVVEAKKHELIYIVIFLIVLWPWYIINRQNGRTQ